MGVNNKTGAACPKTRQSTGGRFSREIVERVSQLSKKMLVTQKQFPRKIETFERMNLSITPYIGVNPIKFGMDFEEVRRALG
jgi:hypothetical protein